MPLAFAPPWVKFPMRWKSLSTVIWCQASVLLSVIAQSYHQSEKSASEFDAIVAQTEQFLADNGRRPRILIAKMGQDGHDRGAKVIASAYSDLGFDVDLSPMFSTPEEIARLAVENDVHVVGASSLAA